MIFTFSILTPTLIWSRGRRWEPWIREITTEEKFEDDTQEVTKGEDDAKEVTTQEVITRKVTREEQFEDGTLEVTIREVTKQEDTKGYNSGRI